MARIPISEIKAGLNGRVEEFCRRYLSGGAIDPGDKTHWKVGNIQGDRPKGEHGGSTVVDLEGERLGQWHDFSSEEHGDLLDVLEARYGKDYLKEAKAFLGWSDDKPHDPPPPQAVTETVDGKSERYRKQALNMFSGADAIEETNAEGYLRGRGIDLDPWPSAFRYIDKARIKFAENPNGKGAKKYAPALLCRVDGVDGVPVGIQRVFLDPANPTKKHPTKEHAKKSLGPCKGGAIRLMPGNKIIGICEGPEKGAALVMMGIANGWFDEWPLAIWAIPGVSILPELQLPPEVEEVWVFGDLDSPDRQGRHAGQEGAQKAADRFLAADRRVKVIFPSKVDEDWDDLMNRIGLELGAEAVRRLIERAHLNQPERPAEAESGPYMNGDAAGYEEPPTDEIAIAVRAPQGDPAPEPEPGDPGPKPDNVVRWMGLPDLQERYVWVETLEVWYDRKIDKMMTESKLDKKWKHCFGQDKASKALLADPLTTKVDALTFAPGQPKDKPIMEGNMSAWNLYSPSVIVPTKGDMAPFLAHISYLCDGNEIAERYLLDWIAFLVQNPGVKIKSSPVLIGTQGTGKSFLTEALRILLGDQNVVEISPEVFENRFNSWMARAQLVVFEEMRVDDKWKMMNKLKPLITNLRVNIELKGVDIYSIPNRANWMFISNDIVGAVIERGDRRYMVIASQAEAKSPDYYVLLFAWLYSKNGSEALVYYFKHLHDCTEFNPNAHAPETDAKRLVQELSKDQVTRDIQELWDDREWPFNCDVVLPKDVLGRITEKHRPTVRAVEIFLHRQGAWHFEYPVRLDTDRRGRPWIVNRQGFWKANMAANREQFVVMLRTAYQKGRNHGSQGITGEDGGALPWGDEHGPQH